MSLDQIYKHKFYIDPSQAGILYQSENSMASYTGVLIRDKYTCNNFLCLFESSGIDRDITFAFKITSHRISINAENNYKAQLDIPLKTITTYNIQEKGFINKKTYIVLGTNKGITFEFYHANIKDIFNTLNSSYNARIWEIADKLQTSSQLYSGIRDIKSQFQAEVRQIQASVDHSTSDAKSLVDKSEKLRELVAYLKKNASNPAQKTEIDEILASIDDVSVITKDEAGKNFYAELAQAVYIVSKELLNRYHGIASLVDVFYITNEKRKPALISPSDLLKACQKFEHLNLPIRLIELNKGLKVIQDVNFNSDDDFKKNIAPYMDEREGLTAEELSRRTRIPLLLALSKLELSLMKGKIIIDDSLEGKRYFHNFLL